MTVPAATASASGDAWGTDAESPFGLFRVRADGVILSVTNRLAALLDATPGQMRGAHWLDRVHVDDREKLVGAFARGLAERAERFDVTVRIETFAGRIAVMSLDIAPVYDLGTGELVGYHGIADDITVRARSEAALAASELRWRSMIENAPIGVCTVTGDLTVLYANPVLEDLVGRAMVGHPFPSFFAAENWGENAEACRQGRDAQGRQARPVQGSLEVVRPDGTRRRVVFTSWWQPEDHDGTWLTMVLDVSARHTGYWLTLADEAAFGVAEVDPDGTVRYANPAFDDLVGQSMGGRSIYEMVGEGSAERRAAWAERRRRDGRVDGEARLVRPDGTEVWVHVMSVQRDDRGFVVLLVDQTALQAEREKIRDATDLTAGLLDAASAGILLEGPQGEAIMVNQAAVDVVGTAGARQVLAAEPTGDPYRRAAHLDDCGPWRDAQVDALMTAIRAGEEPDGSVAALDDGTRVQVDRVAFRRDGADRGALWSFNDVTTRERLVEQLAASRSEALRLARAKDEFVAVVSHELRTPLHAVVALADMLGRSPLAQAEADKIRALHQAAGSLAALVEDILDYACAEVGELRLEEAPFVLRAHLSEQLGMVRGRAVRDHVALDCAVGPEVPEVVRGDARRLGQVLTNLVLNGIQAHETAPRAGAFVRIEVQGAPGGVRFTVCDNGPGFDVARLEHLIQPFARGGGSRQVAGSGLGLPIAMRLVSQMGGALTADSVPGNGASFTFTLPLAAEDPADRGAADACALVAPVGKGRRVLVVEDNELNALITCMQLRELGWEPEAVRDGESALVRLESEAFDCVLVDRQLPGIDGFAVARAVRRLDDRASRGRTPLVALTAAALTSDLAASAEAGFDAHLSKPVTAADLAEALDTVRAGRSSLSGDTP